MRHTIILTLVCILLLGFTAGCGGGKDKQIELAPEGSSDEELYQLGEQHIKKDPDKGRLYFRQVIDSFPKSFYAQRAKLAIADSYFRQGDEGSMIISASEYREFIQLFPYSPSAAYAQYQIGLSYFKKALKPGRDQTKTIQALAEFRIVINKYPLSEEAEQARERIQECEERLAEHSMSVAELYYKRSAYRASISRLTEILTEYPSYSEMDKVYFILADSYYKAAMIDESVPYFRKLISDYPNSKYARKAVKRMDEIEKK
jgi:outer membrane protein assembly factor BamD